MDEAEFQQQVLGSLARIEAQLLLQSGRLGANPVELVQAVGAAVAQAQGYDRPQVADEAAPDLIVTPGMQLYEPWNEQMEREQPDWNNDAENQGWWATMTDGEMPPGELESEGP